MLEWMLDLCNTHVCVWDMYTQSWSSKNEHIVEYSTTLQFVSTEFKPQSSRKFESTTSEIKTEFLTQTKSVFTETTSQSLTATKSLFEVTSTQSSSSIQIILIETKFEFSTKNEFTSLA